MSEDVYNATVEIIGTGKVLHAIVSKFDFIIEMMDVYGHRTESRIVKRKILLDIPISIAQNSDFLFDIKIRSEQETHCCKVYVADGYENLLIEC